MTTTPTFTDAAASAANRNYATAAVLSVLAVACGVFWSVDADQPGDPHADRAAMSACRTWDSGTADGELSRQIATLGEVAADTASNDTGSFTNGFESVDDILASLDAAAEVARYAATKPDLDTTTYRAFRNLSTTLNALSTSTGNGEVLDVAKVRVPAYTKALGTVETLCTPYV